MADVGAGALKIKHRGGLSVSKGIAPGPEAPAGAPSAITPSGRYVNLDPAKLRGGYYTPADVSAWLAAWAIRSSSDSVLEPSCGDGNLLVASVERLLALGATSTEVCNQIQGIELSSAEANSARARVSALVESAQRDVVQAEDFFGWWERENACEGVGRRFDAVVGNPPFIRYQSFPEPARARAMNIMLEAGLKPNKLTNIWVPFIVAATQALKEGGRLALVVPAELLQVTYAAQLRRFLTQRFASVGVVSCNELFFDGAEQEVLLLLADGALRETNPHNDCRVAFVETPTVQAVVSSDAPALLASAERKHVCGDSEKWLKYFLSAKEIEFMRELRRSDRTSVLSEYAEVDVGIVTGKNQFFVLRASEAEARGLLSDCVPLVSRTAHLKSAVLEKQDWIALSAADERVHLLNLRPGPAGLSPEQANYVEWGEAEGFHLGYKCRIRKPWHQVPSLWIPEGFLFRQIYDFPRFIRNKAGATSTDTVHRLSVHGCASEDLIASTYTYLTAASAEIEGRSYGGGVLELEPTEAERLLIPSALGSAVHLEEADRILKDGSLAELLAANERPVLRDQVGLSNAEVTMVKAIWEKLRDRRRGRGRRRSVTAK